MTVNRLEDELEDLKAEVLDMCRMTERMIEGAMKALAEGDAELAREVYEADSAVDDAELRIEKKCMKIMLKRQPYARDFREVSSILKAITDIERIGDQAADIAGLEPQVGATDGRFTRIAAMGEIAVKMVRDSVNAFIREDATLAEATVDRDNELDDAFAEIKKDIVMAIKEDNDCADEALVYLMIAKYLERIGDHAVNVCEWTDYNNSGVHRKRQ